MGRTPSHSLRRGLGWIPRWGSRRAARRQPSIPHDPSDDARRADSRELLVDLADAIEADDAARVSSLIQRLNRLDRRAPRLVQLTLRWAVRRGDPHHALQWLEAQPRLTEQQRLLAILLRCRTGDKALAHLELSDWCASADAPAAARALLTDLDEQAGVAPRRPTELGRINDASQAPAWQARVIQHILHDDLPAAKPQIGMLGHRFSSDRTITAWLASLELQQSAQAQPVPVTIVDELAGQLLVRTSVIELLVAAQRHDPRPAQIDLLRRALRRLVDDVSDPMPIIEALAELSIIAGDPEDARRSIERGLAISPYSARLALMLNQISDTAEIESQENMALSVLRRCAQVHPDYADVRSAMILRCRDSGLHQMALREAQRWVRQSPDHRIAQRVLRELAA